MKRQMVDLFCGAGAVTEGALRAGFEVVLAMDKWPEAIQTYRINHPEIETYCFDLDTSPFIVAQMITPYLDPDAHFHLHGSPPCQALSNASWNTNPENGLRMVVWFYELVAILKPDSFSLESVFGIRPFLDDNNKRYSFVNSADYGVPQRRRRIFAGEGWMLYPTHTGRWVSTADALPHHEDKDFIPVESMKQRWKMTINDPYPTITTEIRSQIKVGGETLSHRDLVTLQGWEGFIWDKDTNYADLDVMIGNMVNPPIIENMLNNLVSTDYEWV